MASQTQKQKAAAAARAAKAAEEAKVAEQEAEKQEEETQSDLTATQGENESVTDPETEQGVDETQADSGKEEVSETEQPAAEVEATAPSANEESIASKSEETDIAEELAKQPSPEVSVQPASGEQVEVAPVDTQPKETPKAESIAVAKVTPRMKRVDVKPADVNINTISTADYFQMKHNYVLGTGSVDLQEIIAFLDRYEDEMARGKVVQEQKGASLQQQLFRTYLRALMLPPLDRTIAMDYILWKFFKNEKSAFRVTNVARFTRSARWDIPELQMYNTMNTIFQAVADPTDRILKLREYKLGAIVSKFPQDKARYTESSLNWTQTLR